MKAIKLLLLLVSLGLLAGNANATITRGQTFNGTTGATNASSLALTVTAPDLTDGKYHYMVIAVATLGSVYPTVDSGYSWQAVNVISGSSLTQAFLFVGRVFSGAGTTITLNASGTTVMAAVGAEYTSDRPLRLDRSAVALGSSTTPSSGATQTTSNANEVCFGALACRLQSSSATGNFTSPGSSYSEILAGGKSSSNNTAGNDREVDLLEKFLTSTGTTTASATVSVSGVWAASLATYEEVPVGSANIPSVGH